MSSLIRHAETELRRAGLFDVGSDYDGMLGESVMKLIRTFAAEGHSGYSAGATLDLFGRLARFKTLTPITSDPAEWQDVTHYGGTGSKPLWQNLRQSSSFSDDGGKTYWDVDAEDPKAINVTEAPAPAKEVAP